MFEKAPLSNPETRSSNVASARLEFVFALTAFTSCHQWDKLFGGSLGLAISNSFMKMTAKLSMELYKGAVTLDQRGLGCSKLACRLFVARELLVLGGQ